MTPLFLGILAQEIRCWCYFNWRQSRRIPADLTEFTRTLNLEPPQRLAAQRHIVMVHFQEFQLHGNTRLTVAGAQKTDT